MADRPDEVPSATETAWRDALVLLERRPRTMHELDRALERGGHREEARGPAIARLVAAGLVDDAALALDFVLARAARLAHGPLRLVADLERRGVAPGVAWRAWERAVEEHGLDPARLLDAALARRLGARRGGKAGRLRANVYNALLRAGFVEPEIVAALDERLPDDPYPEGLEDTTDDID